MCSKDGRGGVLVGVSFRSDFSENYHTLYKFARTNDLYRNRVGDNEVGEGYRGRNKTTLARVITSNTVSTIQPEGS